MSEKEQNTLNILTIAKKAGVMTFGFDAVKSDIQVKKSVCVYVTMDISPKTLKEINYFSEKFGIPVKSVDITMNETEYYLGKKCAIFSVSNKGFADKLEQING